MNTITRTYAEITVVEERTTTQIMALMGPDLPAICTRNTTRISKSETIEVITDLWPAEQERSYNSLREPDLFDDGSAFWVSNKGTVEVPISKLRGFNAFMRCDGLAPGGFGPVKTDHWGPEPTSQYNFIKEVCGL